MKSTDYCKMMDIEMTNWKAKLYDVIRKFDGMPTGQREKVFEDVNALNIIMEELNEKIDSLRTECPVEWRPQQEAINAQLSDLGSKYGETSNQLFDYEVGG